MYGEGMTETDIYRHLRDYRDVLGAQAEQHGARWPEISDGRLIMMMSPRARHQFVGHRLRRQLEPQLPDGVILMVETDVEDASLGILRTPDLVVVDETADLAHREALDPRSVHLIIEIVSRWNASNDYREKVADYPRMGVPHYVIVDPRDQGSAVRHWGISTQSGQPAYENEEHYRYGDTITVGEWKIDTTDLPRYDAGSER